MRCTARAGRYHATNSPRANLDSFSWPRSGEPQGGGEQSSTPRTPMTATASAGCGIARPSPWGLVPTGPACGSPKPAAVKLVVAMLDRGIFEGRYDAQSSTVNPGKRQANNLAWRRLNAPSSARGMKAPHKAKAPTQSSGLFCLPGEAGKPGHLKGGGVTLTEGKTIRLARGSHCCEAVHRSMFT
jgi:hypothetical protein